MNITQSPEPNATVTSDSKIFEQGFQPDEVKNVIAATLTGLSENQQATNIGDALNPARKTIVRSYMEGETKVAGAVVEVPSLDEFIADPDGRKWLEDKIFNLSDKKVSMSLLHWIKAGCKEAATELPKTVADFITTARRSAGTGAPRFAKHSWKEYGDAVLESIKKSFRAQSNKDLSMTKGELELCLSDAAYAEAKFPDLENVGWFGMILDVLIAKDPVTITDKRSGKDKTDNGEIFAHWKATRNDTVANDEIELGELTF